MNEYIAGVHVDLIKLLDPTVGSVTPAGTTTNPYRIADYVYDTVLLSYRVKTTTDLLGGGGGGGPVTIADGADITEGAKADAAWDGAAASATGISIWKYIGAKIEAVRALLAGSLTVTGPLTDTQLRAVAVPVSATTLPLPANAAKETGGNLDSLVAKDFATSAKQDTGNTSLGQIYADLGTVEAKPTAYSVLDRLYQLGLKIDNQAKVGATEATMQKVLAALTKAPAPSKTTLLHR